MEHDGRDTRNDAKGLNLRPFAARQYAARNDPDEPVSVDELIEAAAEAVEEDESSRRASPLDAKTEQTIGAQGQNRYQIQNEQDEDERERMHPKGKKLTVGEVREHDIKQKRVLTEREKLRLSRKKKLIRVTTLATVAVVLIAALLLAYFLLIVDSIDVEGCSRFSEEEILARSELTAGRHIWLMNIKRAKGRIEEDPYIATADIKRVYPDRLVITVKERSEAAVIVGMNVQAVIDSEGYVLYIGARADYTGLIRISGMSSGGYHVNQRLGEESDFNSRTLIELMTAIYNAGVENEIEYVDMSNPLSISMTATSGLILHIGQPEELDNKLENYKKVMPELKRLGYALSGTLDLSAKGDPVYSPEHNADNTGATSDPNATPDPDATPNASATPAASMPAQTPNAQMTESPALTYRPNGFSG